jgi:hypothetical protein
MIEIVTCDEGAGDGAGAGAGAGDGDGDGAGDGAGGGVTDGALGDVDPPPHAETSSAKMVAATDTHEKRIAGTSWDPDEAAQASRAGGCWGKQRATLQAREMGGFVARTQ